MSLGAAEDRPRRTGARRAIIDKVVGTSSGDSPLQIDPGRSRAVNERWALDGRSLLYVLVALLSVFALLAVITNSATMLTRISIGLLVALALDPVVDSIERRLAVRRGGAVIAVAVLVLGVAALIVGVLGPRAVNEIRQFSQQFPETVGELERLPLVGD